MHPVHTIEPLCAAAVGIRTFLDLPIVAGRGVLSAAGCGDALHVHHEVFGRDAAGIPAVDEGVMDRAGPQQAVGAGPAAAALCLRRV